MKEHLLKFKITVCVHQVEDDQLVLAKEIRFRLKMELHV